MGLIAGFYRGTADTVVSRLTEIVMAFPYLLFVIAVAATVGEELNKITFGGLLHPGVFTLVMIFGIFGWFYPARIIRSQILSLREKEFIEAARMTGASDWRIMRSHLLPHLVAPLIVFSTLIVATNVIAEAGSPSSAWASRSDRELGEPARRGAELLPDPAVADGLAGTRDPADDARVQPARRRPARRLRSRAAASSRCANNHSF
jgi:ABC-type polysaccharide transport system permease subunit